MLGVTTAAMIAVPLHFARKVRGVLSVVRFKPERDSTDTVFTPDALPSVQSGASVLSRLIEYRLLAAVVGWR
jgi:hypothetical protein